MSHGKAGSLIWLKEERRPLPGKVISNQVSSNTQRGQHSQAHLAQRLCILQVTQWGRVSPLFCPEFEKHCKRKRPQIVCFIRHTACPEACMTGTTPSSPLISGRPSLFPLICQEPLLVSQKAVTTLCQDSFRTISVLMEPICSIYTKACFLP